MVYDITTFSDLKTDFDSYENLISFYRCVPPEIFKARNIYTEKHHILPRCMGGKDLKDNLIILPWMLHVIAHFLLARKLESVDDQLAIKNYYAVKMILGQDKVVSKADDFENLLLRTKLKALELETINKLNSKRLYVNKDGKTIQIFEESLEYYRILGWQKGRVFRNGKGKVWINNGEESKIVPSTELDTYLKTGWQRGMYKTENMKNYDRGRPLPKTKGYKWVHREDKRLLVSPQEIEKYLNDGWLLGSNQKPMLGKTYTLSTEQRKAISDRLKDKVWWNNGKQNIRAKECPEGFVRGKLHEN